MHYNFVRIHQTLRVTPAMEAGVTDRLWSLEDIVALVEANEPPPKKRGPLQEEKRKRQAIAKLGSPEATTIFPAQWWHVLPDVQFPENLLLHNFRFVNILALVNYSD